MLISRGSIHHPIRSDVTALLASIFSRRECDSVENIVNDRTTQHIKQFFDQSLAVLYPFARTGWYAVLMALNLPPGSVILMTPFNIYPYLDIIHSFGYRVVFVDIEFDSFGPVLSDLKLKLAQSPGCFLLTYLFGYVPDIDTITALCENYNVPLIEDISQVIGAKYKSRLLGTFGSAAIYSASLTKYIDSYNGGFVITSDGALGKSLLGFANTLAAPRSSRIQMIILKTLIWNICLNLYVFNVFTYPLLRLLKACLPRLFNSILGPSIKPANSKHLPSFYFESISNLQARSISRYLHQLPILIDQRTALAKKVQSIHKSYCTSWSAQGSDYTNVYWQYICPVANVDEARKVLFAIGVETGSTNLPLLSSLEGLTLDNADILKSTQLFIPLHPSLSDDNYHRIFRELRIHNLI